MCMVALFRTVSRLSFGIFDAVVAFAGIFTNLENKVERLTTMLKYLIKTGDLLGFYQCEMENDFSGICTEI